MSIKNVTKFLIIKRSSDEVKTILNIASKLLLNRKKYDIIIGSNIMNKKQGGDICLAFL
jgi:hypothetical protein